MASNSNRNYYVSFVTGIIVFIVGLILKIKLVWIAGILFVLYGILNRDKWPGRVKSGAPEEAEPVDQTEAAEAEDEPGASETEDQSTE